MAVKEPPIGEPNIFEKRTQATPTDHSKLNVFQKLTKARIELAASAVKKSGHNGFQNFDYFQLDDFVPTAQRICDKYGLFTKFDYICDEGVWMTQFKVINADKPEEEITWLRPYVQTNTNKDAAQSQGATDTYSRRYMWLIAFEITEADMIDSLDQNTMTGKLSTPKAPKKTAPKATAEQIAELKALYSEAEIGTMLQKKNLSTPEEFTTVEAMQAINFRKGKQS
jgi:hypothetical protein